MTLQTFFLFEKGSRAVQSEVMIPMKKMALEVGAWCSDLRVRPRKLPWKQGCRVEWEMILAIHTHSHPAALMHDHGISCDFDHPHSDDWLQSLYLSRHFFPSHSWSQTQAFSLLGLQRLSSVGYRHGGCRPSCGVIGLRGMLRVRHVRARRGVPWETKLTKTEPHLQPTWLV